MSLQTRIKTIIEHISKDMHEREDIIALTLLGALSSQNTFLYGPPGTAKSLISRRIACAFETPNYFEHLMNRFSTPEELFGPVSIKALKEDQYTRKTNKYLPTADFAFLDEIWKSSPAILNALLTMINEKTFKNGDEIEHTPLKALVAASNETPVENQGLEALYDRFIIRLIVGPITQKSNFEALINAKPTQAQVELPKKLKVASTEWQSWLENINKVLLSPETLLIIHAIRGALSERYEELNVYVSDRRWQKVAQLLKASAFFNDRKETNHSDALLINHCIWTKEENREEITEIVYQAIDDVGFTSDISLDELDKEKESLDKEINKELFYKSNVYKTVKIGSKQYFLAKVKFTYDYGYYDKKTVERTLYIPYSQMKSRNSFHPVDAKGNELDDYDCSFDGHGTCNIKGSNFNGRNKAETTYTPKVLFHKGDKKEDVNQRLISSLAKSVVDVRKSLIGVLAECEQKSEAYKKRLYSPFVSEELLDIPLEAINEQLSDLKLRIKDCERLEALCHD